MSAQKIIQLGKACDPTSPRNYAGVVGVFPDAIYVTNGFALLQFQNGQKNTEVGSFTPDMRVANVVFPNADRVMPDKSKSIDLSHLATELDLLRNGMKATSSISKLALVIDDGVSLRAMGAKPQGTKFNPKLLSDMAKGLPKKAVCTEISLIHGESLTIVFADPLEPESVYRIVLVALHDSEA